MKRIVLMLVVTALILAAAITADVPQMINYQGRLTNDQGDPLDGNFGINFTVYNDSVDGNSLWSSGNQYVEVTEGVFTYKLGSITPLPDDLFAADTVRYLGIAVQGDPEITPRTGLITVPYAYQALRADSAQYATIAQDISCTNCITAAEIAPNAITNAEISSSADISVSKISGTAVNLSSSQTITGDKTFDGNIFYGDSTLRINNDGIALGTNIWPPGTNQLILAHRYYNDAALHYGMKLNVEQDGGGKLYGIRADANAWGAEKYAIRGEAGGDGPAYGLYGRAFNDIETGHSYGVKAYASGGDRAYGIFAEAYGGTQFTYAGYFDGDVEVTGTLSEGGGSFKIDHPLDQENKYLQHSSVESPDMMNIYNGNVTLDGSGEATVILPDYFETLNMDFRYQLTCIGVFAPVYIADEISSNQFRIAGGTPGMKVSWQVTGIRHDKWAEANRVHVEIDKLADERGKYLHPEAFGLGEEYGLHYEELKRMEEDTRERSQEQP